MKTPPQPKAPRARVKSARKNGKARKAGVWCKIKGHRFAWCDFPAIAGSYRDNQGVSVWTTSSVWGCKGWDADRTHFLTLPKPPASPAKTTKRKEGERE